MRTFITAWTILVLTGCGSSSQSGANRPRNPRHPIASSDDSGVALRATLEQGALMQGSDGEVYVGVWLDAPEAEGADERPPIAVSLVIDRSGSMQGDGIVRARESATSFLETLKDGDIVSIYAFDDEVSEVVAPTRLEPPIRAELVEAVSRIRPGGSTNLYGGLEAATNALADAPDSHPVRRVFLVSDGMANIGPASPEELGVLAARAADHSAQVTTLGVGLEYDERTLGEIAMRSAGRYHHLTTPQQLAAALEEELSIIDETVAFDTVVEIVPAEGVEVVSAEGLDVDHEGNRSAIMLGSLSSGQSRHILVRMRADTEEPGEKPFAAVRLRYKAERDADEDVSAVALTYRVTSDEDVVDESRDDDVAALALRYQSARVQQEAVGHLNAGEGDAAADVLERQAAAARGAAAGMAAPAAAPLREQANQLEERARRARRAREDRRMLREEALENNAESMDAMGF